MIPEFASPCEDPLAWTCPACATFQLETGGRPLRPEQAAMVRELGSRGTRPAALAGSPGEPVVRIAREILSTYELSVPVDVARAAALLGYPVEWVARPSTDRGGIGRDAGAARLLLNRNYAFRSDAERRWVIAEELAHAVLGHTALAAADAPAQGRTLRSAERAREERDARRFAAELLMPESAVRTAFGKVEPRLRRALGGREREDVFRRLLADLARRFQVSPAAMRIRLEQLTLLH